MRKLILMLAALAALVVAAPASAVTITGGTTTVTPNQTALGALSANGIAASVTGRATVQTGSFVFPITRGHVNRRLRGVVFHAGGLKFTKGDDSFAFRRPVIVSTRRGVVLKAIAGPARCRVVHRGRHHGKVRVLCRLRVRNILRLTNLSVTGTTVTATAKLTAYSARRLNRLAGPGVSVFTPGLEVGTARVEAQVR